MAMLATKARKALPKSDFGLPAKKGANGRNAAGRGAYPMPDRKHAAVAKGYATKEARAGKLSQGAEAKIDAKANKLLKRK